MSYRDNCELLYVENEELKKLVEKLKAENEEMRDAIAILHKAKQAKEE